MGGHCIIQCRGWRRRMRAVFIVVGADHLAAVEAKVLLHLEMCSAAAVGLHPRRLHVQMSVPGERGGGACYVALTLGQGGYIHPALS